MIRKNICIVTAAALTVGSIWVSPARAQVQEVPARTDNVTNNAADAVNKAGDRLDRAADRATSNTDRAVNNTDRPMTNTDRPMTKNDRPADRMSAPTNSNAMAPDAGAIGSVIAQVTEAGVKKGTFDDLVERFVDADRNRLGQDGFSEKEQPELDALATKLDEAWRSKYGHAFSIDSAAAYPASFLMVRQSEIGQAGQSNRMVTKTDRATDGMSATGTNSNRVDMNGNTNTSTDSVPNTGAEVTTKRDGGMAGPTGPSGGVDMTAAADQQKAKDANAGATAKTDDTSRKATNNDVTRMETGANRTATGIGMGIDSPASPAADANRNDVGRNIANVTIPASHGLRELQVQFIHEFPSAWKIDLNDSIDGPTLARNLAAHLNAITAMQAQWPADENEAYRAVTHHILAAIQNVPAEVATAN